MRSILVHIYEDEGLEARLQAAFDLARAFGGHLTCLHATPYEDYLAADPIIAAALPIEFSKKMEDLRERLRARIEARLAGEGLSWDWVHRDEPIATALIRYSIMADVVIVSLGAGLALERRETWALAAPVAVHGPAPVLAVPNDLERLRLDAPALVAWNGSAEAAAAIRGALPLLKLVPGVTLVQFEDDAAASSQDWGAVYLSRHDVHPELMRRPREDDVGAAIRRTALELGAGLVVMGAFGRSRLRELVMGGVTRSMLDESRLPLLLAH